MTKATKLAKKVIIALIGFPLLLLGIILIPLPGPGLLVVFAALVILSGEFDWANKYSQAAREKLKSIYEKSKAPADKINRK